MTPGPWIADTNDRNALQIWSEKGTLIANMCGQRSIRGPNSRAIVAVPDLIQALEALRDAAARLPNSNDIMLEISAASQALHKAGVES